MQTYDNRFVTSYIYSEKKEENPYIWILLFLLGIDVGGNESIIIGLHTLGLEAIIITVAAVAGSTLCAWGLWYLLYKWNGGKETKA